ncbi:MAG: hypothetical protein ACRC8S_12845 [Fimbriiglobus sp.]
MATITTNLLDATGPVKPSEGIHSAAWAKRFQEIDEIDATHQKYNDIEAPLIPAAIIQGTRRLVRLLEAQGSVPPTCMTGTVDATICLEWHAPVGGERFISIDVIGIDQYEIFTYHVDKPSTIEVVSF